MVIPAWSGTQELTDMLVRCMKSFQSQVDELIVTDDSNIYHQEIHGLADIYLLHKKLGYTKNINLGWKIATGDFVALVNSDTELISGSLGDLCVPGVLAYPILNEVPNPNPQMCGPFFVLPRNLFEKYGMFDIQFYDDGADYELWGRYKINGVPTQRVMSVEVKHIGGSPGPSRRVA